MNRALGVPTVEIMATTRLPVRLPTFDSRLVEDLALLVKLTAAQLRPIAEVAVSLIVSKVYRNTTDLQTSVDPF